MWKMYFVVSLSTANIVFQAVLVGVMWGYNRFDRPSYSSGLFLALALASAAVSSLMALFEGQRVKRIEGKSAKETDFLTPVELRAYFITKRRNAWTLQHYARLWEEEKENWAIIRS